MSLERLINLAKRTGDRLIVHDPLGVDVVILSIDDYEQLHEEADVAALSADMLDDMSDTLDAYDQQSHWHSTEDVIDERYQDLAASQPHGQHNRQYQEEDWEEVHQAPAAPPVQAPVQPEPSMPVSYQPHDDVHVAKQDEQQLDEPVFYEEPV